jgi:hypothetical protein
MTREDPKAVRRRAWLSTALVVVAVAGLVAGGACLYVRSQLLSSHRFANRTVTALDRPAVRRVVSREIVTQVVERAAPDLLAARPLLTSAVEGAVTTPQFKGIVRALAAQAHRLLFDRGGNVVFSVADAGQVAISAVRTLAPAAAAKIPPSVDATLLDLRRQSFAVRTLRAADRVRLLALILPPAAIAMFALALVLAPRRRRILTAGGVALAVASLAVFADLELLRHSLLTSLFGAEGLTDADVREAAGELWDLYAGPFASWMLALAAFGAVLAAVASGVLRPGGAARALVGAWQPTRRPPSRLARGAGGFAAALAGVLLLVRPTFALDLLAVAGGVLLVSFGLGELLAAFGIAAPARPVRGVPRALAPAAAALAVLVAGPAIALAVRSPAPSHVAAAGSGLTCNGYAQLCGRRLNEVVFAGTHNSMSASESPGWLIANQRRPVARQLADGIRAFKISTHYGVGSSPGHIQTDIAASGEKVNRVSEKLTEQARTALQRLTGSLGFGRHAKGRRAVWLCHTLCELGATKMSVFLGTVARFLRSNPDEVLVFFDEDYVSESSLEAEFKRAGLFGHLAVFQAGRPLPTLGEMIRSQHNIAVFAQEPVSGEHPWDMYAFSSWIQDTPLGAVEPSQFSCAPARGVSTNPLLMMNNWADVFPPRRSPNLPLLKRSFIVGRARQCERERHRLPNLILTDFYDSGDVIGAVRELNGVGEEKPSPVVAVSEG